MPIRIPVTLAWEQAQRIRYATSVTEGKVTAFDPSNHSTGTVEYWVDGARYEVGSSGMSSSYLGRTVPVHYDPQNPAKAYVGNQPPSFTHNLIGIAILVIFFLTGILLAVFGSQRIRSKSTRTRPPNLPHKID